LFLGHGATNGSATHGRRLAPVNLAGEVALVTGASGLVGSTVIKRLLAEGMRVRGLMRRPADLGAGVTACLGDVRDSSTVARAVDGAALVVHCAAVLRRATREEAFAVNVEGTRAVLRAASRANCERFIHISTTSVHDLEGRDVVDEATPFIRAGDPYGESKAAAEDAVWAANGLPMTVLRPPAILDAHPNCHWTVGIPKQIASGEFRLQGEGEYALPYVHVRNLADAVVLAARSDRAIGQAYIVLDGHTTWRELTHLFRGWLGSPDVPSVSPSTVPPAYRWHGRWSGEKLRRELGYEPQVTWQAAMAETKTYLADIGVLKG
jgi:nucleoside-diphosphate-sugar epimerase